MKASRSLLSLSWLTALLVACYAALGLFWLDGGARSSFTTLHGQTVQLYGQGVYRFDTLLIAAGNRGTDAVMLFAVVPLLAAGIALARRGSLAGGLVLASALAACLYNAASLTFGAAYNRLVFLYIAAFSAGLFAFILALTSFDLGSLEARFSARLPRRGMAAFLIFAGLATAAIWLSDMLPPWLQGGVPQVLGSYTTVFTYGIDLALITPATVLSGVLLLRRRPLGLVLGPVLLTLCALIGVMVVSQTLFQLNAGVVFSPGQFIGLISSWVVLGAAALFLLAGCFRALERK